MSASNLIYNTTCLSSILFNVNVISKQITLTRFSDVFGNIRHKTTRIFPNLFFALTVRYSEKTIGFLLSRKCRCKVAHRREAKRKLSTEQLTVIGSCVLTVDFTRPTIILGMRYIAYFSRRNLYTPIISKNIYKLEPVEELESPTSSLQVRPSTS